MDWSDRVLGSTVAKQLRERTTAPLLRIGSDIFDRTSLSHVACFNFVAAANLSTILNRELRVKNTRDLFETIAPAALALPHLGAVSLAVLGAAFEAKGIGGAAPLEAWVTKHSAKNDPLVTFDTIKHREAAAAKAERRTRQHITHARKSKAHGLRLARFHRKAS